MTIRTLYHGTRQDFDAFDPSKGEGFGIHFADSPTPCWQLLYDNLPDLDEDIENEHVLACEVSMKAPMAFPDLRRWSPVLIAQELVRKELVTNAFADCIETHVTEAIRSGSPSGSLGDVLLSGAGGVPISEIDTVQELQAQWNTDGSLQALHEGDTVHFDEMLATLRAHAPKHAAGIEVDVLRQVSPRALHQNQAAVRSAIKEAGYDSLTYANTFEGGAGYVVFDAEQVLSKKRLDRPVKESPGPAALKFKMA